MPVRAVLLDMGGVLIPEPRGYQGAARDTALHAALSELGIDDVGADVQRRSDRLRQAYRALARSCTQPDLDEVFSDLPEPVRALLIEAFCREATQAPYSGVAELVAALAAEYPLALVSNTVLPGDHHARNLEAAGILGHFRVALWSGNFGRRKPDPAMLLHALDILDVAPTEAVMVGDKIRTDVAAARAAGVPSIWIRTSARSHEAEPDYQIDALAALLPLLRTL